MSRIAGNAPGAPQAIGPYSHYVIAHGVVYVSGQIPLEPSTGELVAGDVSAQARRVLDNLAAVLDAAGSSLGKVVRCGVYLAEMSDFPAVNAVYAEYFPSEPPARSTMAVKALPRGVAVEIDCIAVL